MSIVLAIPDLHCPHQHVDAFDFLAAVKKAYKPTDIVCLGDEFDASKLSRWAPDPDTLGAGDELTATVAELKKLYKLFPKVISCISNHTDRPFRKALEAGLPRRLIRPYHEFLEAPKGWSWADSVEIDGVIYEHGESAKGGPTGAISVAMQNMQSTVIGHLHSHAGIQYGANSKFLLFGFNVGCLINRHAPVFNYAKLAKNKPILGCGIIRNGNPTFIPMLLDGKGRWTNVVP